MKKLILTGSLIVSAVTAFGQGQLIMANNAATRITNSVTGVSWAAGPGSQVAIYALSGNGQPESSLALQTTAMTNLFIPGQYQGNTRTLGIPAGPATVQVRAWSGSFPSYEAALLAGTTDPSVLVGRSVIMNMNLTLPGPSPAPALTGSGLNQMNVVPVPEPSSIALGLLGLGAIVLFRRRK